jgi:hypothetical protein
VKLQAVKFFHQVIAAEVLSGTRLPAEDFRICIKIILQQSAAHRCFLV